MSAENLHFISPDMWGREEQNTKSFRQEAVRGKPFFTEELVTHVSDVLRTPVLESETKREWDEWQLSGEYFSLTLSNDTILPVGEQTINGAYVQIDSPEEVPDRAYRVSPRQRIILDGISRVSGGIRDGIGSVTFSQFPLKEDPNKHFYVPRFGSVEPRFSAELELTSEGGMSHEVKIYPPRPFWERIEFGASKTIFDMGEKLKALKVKVK